MRMRGIGIVAGLVMTAAPVLAQAGPQLRGPRGGAAGAMVPGVERNIGLALGRAAELGLSEDQVRELRAMQEEMASVRGELEQEARDYRQRVREEQRALRERQRAEMEGLRERRREALEPFPERYGGVLSSAQRNQIREWVREDAVRDRRVGARIRAERAFRIRARAVARGRGIGPA